MNPRKASWILTVVAVVSVLPPAAAEPGPTASSSGVPPTEVDEAARHFKRGVESYQAGDMPGALVEFRAANALVPNYKILYNLGQVAQEMRDSSSALRYYREYLASGGTAVRSARRKEVENAITELATRVGRLTVEVVGGPASLTLDGDSASPELLADGITLNPGPHQVVVIFAGHAPERHPLEIVAGGAIDLVVHRPNDPLPAAVKAAPAPVAAVTKRPWVLRQRAEVWTWSLTTLVAGAAVVTGLTARSYSRGLVDERKTVPADVRGLDWYQRRTKKYALITDGLLAGGTVLALVSIYLSLRDHEVEAPRDEIGLGMQVGPGRVAYGWKF
jgi:hypothetical protein